MTRYFYALTYKFKDDHGEHSFFIGYFSSKKNANVASDILKTKSGFKENKGTFITQRIRVLFDKTEVKKSELVLYEASHEYLDNEGFDNFRVFGLYETRREAQIVIAQKSKQHPYIVALEGFCIAECRINQIGWLDGFSSW